jgi:Sulfotransferase domain
MFDLDTWSIYDDTEDLGRRPEAAALIGHRVHGRPMDDFVEFAEHSAELFYVKTHELPRDDAPALYMLRDGRSAAVSCLHYGRALFGSSMPIEHIIRGEQWPGSWSDHVKAWVSSGRPNTLVIRYEQLAAGDRETLDRLAMFVGRSPTRPFGKWFGEFNEVFPEFFRAGSDQRNIAELSRELRELFEALHGETLRNCGYL